MITVPAGIRVLVATKPVDFRRGADSLAAVVREQLKHDRKRSCDPTAVTA
jgi:transposase